MSWKGLGTAALHPLKLNFVPGGRKCVIVIAILVYTVENIVRVDVLPE